MDEQECRHRQWLTFNTYGTELDWEFNGAMDGVRDENGKPLYIGEIMNRCQGCGIQFHVPPSRIRAGRGKFCSRECRKTQVEKECQTCGAPISVIPSQLAQGRGKFCSRECYEIGEKTQVEIACIECGEPFQVIPSELRRGRKFCSKACYGKNSSKRPSTKIEVTCAICEQPFSVFASQVSLIKTCPNPECRRKYRTRRRARRTCQTCGGPIEVIPSRVAVGGGIFCSTECTRPRVRDTDLELPVFAILDLFGKTYSRKKKIPSERKTGPPFQLDACIFLKDSIVDLEADGKHWHDGRKEADLRRDRIMDTHGIEVLRLPGDVIKRIAPLCDTGASYCLSELRRMAQDDIRIARFVQILESE